MKVFVAGATGVLGKRLVRQFSGEGHEVVGLSRGEEGDEIIRQRGGKPHRGDILEESTLLEGARGADVLIHAATAIPTSTKPSPEEWEQNDRIRRRGTRNLTDVATRVGARQYLQQSITWVARQPDGSAFDEESPVHPDRITQSALDGEQIARQVGEEHELRVGILRCGWFYAADAHHTRELGSRLANRRLPILGGGLLGRNDATVSLIHVEDAAGAFLRTAETGAEGLWHIVDDRPVTVAEFLKRIARRLGVEEPYRIPGWLARPLIGSYNVKFFTTSKPTTNRRARDELEWEPRFPTLEEGIEEVVGRWEEEGFPPED